MTKRTARIRLNPNQTPDETTSLLPEEDETANRSPPRIRPNRPPITAGFGREIGGFGSRAHGRARRRGMGGEREFGDSGWEGRERERGGERRRGWEERERERDRGRDGARASKRCRERERGGDAVRSWLERKAGGISGDRLGSRMEGVGVVRCGWARSVAWCCHCGWGRCRFTVRGLCLCARFLGR